MSGGNSAAAELVDEANNVVFAEIGAGLHLDHLEADLAGVGETMDRALRYVDRLVLVQNGHLVVDRDLGRSLDADPVLGAVVMLLQGELLFRMDEETLHLEAIAVEDRCVATPGAQRR